MQPSESKTLRKSFFFSSGRFYFSSSQERRFFYWATVAMALLGLLYHWGVLH